MCADYILIKVLVTCTFFKVLANQNVKHIVFLGKYTFGIIRKHSHAHTQKISINIETQSQLNWKFFC